MTLVNFVVRTCPKVTSKIIIVAIGPEYKGHFKIL